MEKSFLTLLEESAEAAIPATAESMQRIVERLETMRAHWDARAPHLDVDELAELRQRLGELGLLIDHAAHRRLGLARHMQAMESGYTASGLPPERQATSWECRG